MFIFDKDRKLRYNGRFDDSRYAEPETVKHPDACNAVEALLAGNPVPVETTPTWLLDQMERTQLACRRRRAAMAIFRRYYRGDRRQRSVRFAQERVGQTATYQSLGHLVRTLRGRVSRPHGHRP